MPVVPAREVTPFRYAMSFDGVDDYVVIFPFTVYGWSGATFQEWIYAFHPKRNNAWTKFSMIGDPGVDHPAIFYSTDYPANYTVIATNFATRMPDGSYNSYGTYISQIRNTWANVVQRFTADREYSIWINGVKIYSVTVPSNEITVFEWNPDTATYPLYYKRLVLGANIVGGENMYMLQHQLLIYNRALMDSEIVWNYKHPERPILDGLMVQYHAYPDFIRDVDGDNIPDWEDLSSRGNHGKITGATLSEEFKYPVRPAWEV